MPLAYRDVGKYNHEESAMMIHGQGSYHNGQHEKQSRPDGIFSSLAESILVQYIHRLQVLPDTKLPTTEWQVA